MEINYTDKVEGYVHQAKDEYISKVKEEFISIGKGRYSRYPKIDESMLEDFFGSSKFYELVVDSKDFENNYMERTHREWAEDIIKEVEEVVDFNKMEVN